MTLGFIIVLSGLQILILGLVLTGWIYIDSGWVACLMGMSGIIFMASIIIGLKLIRVISMLKEAEEEMEGYRASNLPS